MLCWAVQCAMLCLLCCINMQHNNDIMGQMSMAFISPTFTCLCTYFMINLFMHLLVYLSPSPSQVSHSCMWLSTTAEQVCMPPVALNTDARHCAQKATPCSPIWYCNCWRHICAAVLMQTHQTLHGGPDAERRSLFLSFLFFSFLFISFLFFSF